MIHGQEKFTREEFYDLFPDGIPMVIMKLIFPEKSEPLTIGDIRQIARSMASPPPQDHLRGDLYDADAFMADGGDTPMTAAEAVLAWLLVEKIGIPDDVGYSPNQAQEIIVRRLDLARELEEIDGMLAEGQGDDEGHPIMPEFTKGMTTYAKVEACLHLLERRRDALAAEGQP